MSNSTFNKAEIHLHIAAQMISLTGINFGEKKADDSHKTAQWDTESARILGRTFELNGNVYRVFVDVRAFELGLEKDGEVADSFPLDELTYSDTIASWKKWFADAGYTGNYVLELQYELPDTPEYQFDSFEKPSSDILIKWAALRTRANEGLSVLNTELGIFSEINIWPHHFDTGTYYVLHETDGAADRSIGAGLAVADSIVSESYFYIYGWGQDQKIDYSDAPVLCEGWWVKDGFEGAILPGTTCDEVNEFFRAASAFLRRKLA